MKRTARKFSAFIGIFTITLWASFANAQTTEELCEKLHAEYLLKAQKALEEDKLEDALRFLLEAQVIAKTCADSSERPLPQRQIRESSHAFATHHNWLS
jgi:hypothetical protein